MPEQIIGLEESLDKVNSTFRDHFYQMDFFFCYKNNRVRTIFNIIRSLPNLLLRVSDDNPRSVCFEATWTNVNNNSPIPRQGGVSYQRGMRRDYRRPQPNYFAHSFMGIPMAHQVNIFEYGFEILSEAGIDMIAIKSICLEDTSISYLTTLVGQNCWAVPPVIEGTNVETQHFWRAPADDDFDEFIRRRQRGEPQSPTPNDGKRSLLIDEDAI